MNKWYYIFVPALALTTYAFVYFRIPYYLKEKFKGPVATHYGGWVR